MSKKKTLDEVLPDNTKAKEELEKQIEEAETFEAGLFADGPAPNIHGSRVISFKSKAKEIEHIEEQRQEHKQEQEALNAELKKSASIIDLADPKLYQDIDDPASLLKRFNMRYFVIKKYFGKCVIAEFIQSDNHLKLDVISPEMFIRAYENIEFKIDGKVRNIANLWLKWPDRRQVEEVIFDPKLKPGLQEKNNKLNLWMGFACEPKQGDCTTILEFHKSIVCGGDEQLYEKLMDQLAYGVQKPWALWHKAIICASKEEGSGKGFFANCYGGLFGQHSFYLSDPEMLTGSFTGHLEGKVLVIADEVALTGKKENNKLKSYTTEPQIAIHHKGYAPQNRPNCLKVILTTNSDHAILASSTARRWLCLRFSNHRIGDLAYFKKLDEDLENGDRQSFLHFLLNRDISRFNPYEIVETDMLKEQKEKSLTLAERFVLFLLDSGACPKEQNTKNKVEHNPYRYKQWWATFKQIRQYVEENQPETRMVSSNKIGPILRAVGFEDKYLDGRVRWWLPDLKAARAKWNEIYKSDHKWNDNEDWERVVYDFEY